MPDPVSVDGKPPVPVAVEGEYYFDGQFLVFAAGYHLRRGYCCGNECRHCPYDENGNAVAGKGE